MSFLVLARSRAKSAIVCLLPVVVFACATSETRGTFDVDPTEGDASADASGKRGTSDAGSKAKPATADSACSDYAKARCAKDESCNGFLFRAQWGDTARCEQQRTVGCADRFTAEGATWKPDNLAACAKSLDDAACDDLNLDVLPSACEVSAGTLEDGAACAHDDQCENGLCKKGSVGGCGSCAKRAKAGSSCSVGTDCEAGLQCVNYSCRAPAKNGETCNSTKPCVFGLVCNGGKCKQGQPSGSTCGEEPGLPDPCDQAHGVVCSPLIMSCVEAKVVAIGDDCSAYGGEICEGGGVCDGYQCVPPLEEGDSCQVTGDLQCQFPMACKLGKCVVLTAATCAD
jgi:hypothetical protein